jgi:DNA-directed RNA polymerase specialized sigma subunit
MGTSMKPKSGNAVTGTNAGRRTLYEHADAMLRGAHNYPLLEHADAVFLANQLDDCLYNVIQYVDANCSWFRDEYIAVVESYIESPADRNSYAALHDDSILPASLFWVYSSKTNWVDKVRNEVTLFRTYWMRSLTKLTRLVENYCADAGIFEDDGDYVYAKERCSKIEEALGVNSDMMYGMANEILYWSKRVDKIVDKMTCPYIRRIGVLAKQYVAGDPEAFLDNLDAGVEGINVAVGRYHVTMGSFAGIVDVWIRNKMLAWVRKVSNPIRVPDRVHTHKRNYEREIQRAPLATVPEIAKMIGITSEKLASSLALSDMQGMSPLIDESMTDDYGAGNEAYLDTSLMDTETVNTFMLQYKHVLSNRDKALIALMFDCDVDGMEFGTSEDIERESLRQMLHAHRRSADAASTQRKRR